MCSKPICLMSLPEKEIRTDTLRDPCEDAQRRRLSTSQGERPWKESTLLLTLRAQIYNLQNREKNYFWLFKLPSLWNGSLNKLKHSLVVILGFGLLYFSWWLEPNLLLLRDSLLFTLPPRLLTQEGMSPPPSSRLWPPHIPLFFWHVTPLLILFLLLTRSNR